MSEWWTYRLSDLLMFSPETYHRLFERYNQDVWPLQLVLLALGMALVVLLRRGDARSDRRATVLLAACWLLVGWLFHWQRFREIHLAAGWFAAASLLQALLLVTPRGRLHSASHPPDIVGVGLLLFGVLLQPLIGPVLGRSWEATQCFGMAPDPTATATLGVLLATRSRWFLWLLPALYSVVSGATLWAMESPDAWVPPIVVLIAVARCIFSPRPQPGGQQ